MTEQAVADTTEQTTVEGQGQDEQHDNGTASKRNTAPIQLTVPLDFKAQIEKAAEDAGKTTARWVLEQIAANMGYVLPETQTRQPRQGALVPRTLSPEARKERYDAARTLLAALDKGEIDLEAIKARLGLS